MGTTNLAVNVALDDARCDFSSGLAKICRDDFERGGFANSPFVSTENLSVTVLNRIQVLDYNVSVSICTCFCNLRHHRSPSQRLDKSNCEKYCYILRQSEQNNELPM